MRIFVTGASGWIGSAAIEELHRAGHAVLGLARSDASAATVTGLGAEVVRGELADLDVLTSAAKQCDGVVHLGYVHDFTRMDEAARTDRAAIETFGAALAGSGKPLLIASGTLGLKPGEVGTEDDLPADGIHPRTGNGKLVLDLADRGVRSIVVRFAPTVHGPNDHGFIASLVSIARDKGAAGYVGDGANRWPAVHRLDAAKLVQLAIDKAPARTVLHATAEDGIATRDIAEEIGRGLDLPVVSVPTERAVEHFGWMGSFIGADAPASSVKTRELLDWKPTHPTLLEDLRAGAYF